MTSLLQGNALDFRYRFESMVAIFLLVLAEAAFIERLSGPLWIDGGERTRKVAVLSAIAVSTVGLVFRVWATGHLTTSVIMDKEINTGKLVTTGPYAYTRNPLYLGTFLSSLALSCLLSWRAMGIQFVLAAFRVARLITFEELELRQKFGAEFEAYCRRVPALFIWPHKFGAALSDLLAKTGWVYALRGNAYHLLVVASYAVMWFVPSLWVQAGQFAISLVGDRIFAKRLQKAKQEKAQQ